MSYQSRQWTKFWDRMETATPFIKEIEDPNAQDAVIKLCDAIETLTEIIQDIQPNDD